MDNFWIGVDLDGTLAKYDGWRGITHIGEPIPEMVRMVKDFLDQGITVKIFTARISDANFEKHDAEGFYAAKKQCIDIIQSWCKNYIGVKLEVTNEKDFGMISLYDDRCVRVEFNTGRILSEEKRIDIHPNNKEDESISSSKENN